MHNVYTIDDLEKNNVDALSYRYLTYTSHYRNKLNFTWDGVKAAQVSLNRLRELTMQHKGVENKVDEEKIKDFEKRFLDAINDDINIPVALSVVWEVAKEQTKSNDYFNLLKKFDTVLSLDLDKEENKEESYPEEVEKILEERKIARDEKDFQKSDILRDKLKELGYIVMDSKEGQKLKKV